ncbi:hypothetical protein [Roseateles violae]|uniref:Uncharacterized protein n=1 Tax=Roseateles violae TaxID=3058042 RepID=A0ABT8DUU7_9BURK|nr:hypothetical protein [Pelomonas sp. PFR6]MDN3920084.1 hypothetical protein [Pelomonas sp. PFR6]
MQDQNPQAPIAADPDGASAAETTPGDEAPPGTPGTGEKPCPECGGSGRAEDGGDCPSCGGSGTVVAGVGGG